MRNVDLSKRSWRSLPSQEKRDRKLVVSLLDRVRNGEDFAYVLADLGISMDLVLEHGEPYL